MGLLAHDRRLSAEGETATQNAPGRFAPGRFALGRFAIADFLIAATLILAGVGEMFGRIQPGHHRLEYAIYPLLAVPLLVRRSRPAAAFLATVVLALVQVFLGLPPWLSDVTVLLTLYTVVAHGPRWAASAGTLLAGATFGLVSGMVALRLPLPTSPALPFGRDGAVLTTALLALACALGYVVRERRACAGPDGAGEPREHDVKARVTATAEQTRMVHELHDMVAHNVSAMVVQADGAQYILDADPAQTRHALEVISATGRQSLAEMRQLMRMLRAPEEGDGFVPQPGMEQMSELVDQVRAAGVPVEFAVVGEPAALGQTGELAAYRIVQEALVSTLRRGGSTANAEVFLRYGDGTLEIEIVDDGRGVVGDLPDDRDQALVRMRERAAMFGGTLRAGPREDGGFRVVATLPISRIQTPADERGTTGSAGAFGAAGSTSAGGVIGGIAGRTASCTEHIPGAVDAAEVAGTRHAGFQRLLGNVLPASMSEPGRPA